MIHVVVFFFGGRERKIDQLLKQTKWKSTFHKKRNQNTQKLCYVQVTPIFTLLQGMEQLTNSVKAEILFRSRDQRTDSESDRQTDTDRQAQ